MCIRILVVDDEPDMIHMIKDALEIEGYIVDTAANGTEALIKAEQDPDLIILDVMLPGQNGFEVCQDIRSKVSCPIVFLSARDQEEDRIKGLVVGGDDYLVKPFGIKELRVRIHAHLRREERTRPYVNGIVLRFGELSIDVQGRTVTYRKEGFPFTRREFDIIELLSLHPGQVLTKEHIYEKVWGFDAEGDTNTVTEHIKKIRGKLSSVDATRQYIITIWGVGYKWEVVR